jgi:Ion channel
MAMDRWLPIWEILLGSAGLIVSLLVHGFGMAYVQKKNRDYQRFAPFRFRRQVTFSLLILLLVCTHLVEVLLWAAALVFTGAVPVIRDAFYYAAVTYTTLGYNENTLSHHWRIIAPMIAMSGVFAFGWTTSVLFSIVSSHDDAQRNTEGA